MPCFYDNATHDGTTTSETENFKRFKKSMEEGGDDWLYCFLLHHKIVELERDMAICRVEKGKEKYIECTTNSDAYDAFESYVKLYNDNPDHIRRPTISQLRAMIKEKKIKEKQENDRQQAESMRKNAEEYYKHFNKRG